jgi:hypothetical protein
MKPRIEFIEGENKNGWLLRLGIRYGETPDEVYEIGVRFNPGEGIPEVTARLLWLIGGVKKRFAGHDD